MDSLVKSVLGEQEPAQAETFGSDQIKIVVVGVGGGGNNTVNRLIRSGVKGCELVAVNTDRQHLNMIHEKAKKVLIGKTITKGLGAGGYPDTGAKAAEIDRPLIEKELEGAHLVFICAGMGGGTGTGAAPVIAEIAKEQGAIVVSVVTVPFRLERARMQKAKWGLERLAAKSDTVIVIENDRLVSYVPNLPITEAFNLADAITGRAITGIADTIMLPSLMNIDFADVKSVMENGGFALLSMGEGHGPARIDQEVRHTLEQPLLDVSPEGAKGALLHISGGTQLTLGEGIEIGEKISSSFDLNADVKIGARLDPSLGDTVSCTAIVTGIKNPYIEAKKEADTRKVVEMDAISYL